MLDKLMQLFEGPSDQSGRDEADLKVATAALLVHAGFADGKMGEVEEQRVRQVLADHFDLSEADVCKLVRAGEREENEAVDLHRFTRVVADALDNEERQQVIRMVWEVILADGEIHEREDVLIARLAGLLGVDTRDRIRLRKEVEAARASA